MSLSLSLSLSLCFWWVEGLRSWSCASRKWNGSITVAALCAMTGYSLAGLDQKRSKGLSLKSRLFIPWCSLISMGGSRGHISRVPFATWARSLSTSLERNRRSLSVLVRMFSIRPCMRRFTHSEVGKHPSCAHRSPPANTCAYSWLESVFISQNFASGEPLDLGV